jgi:hypothetical protein
MVHRTNKEIATDCASQEAGQTRVEQRANAHKRLLTQQAEDAASARDADPMNQQYKRIKLTQAHLDVISAQNSSIAAQLKLYNDNRDSYIKVMSEDQYNKVITDLLAKLPNPDVSNLF